jgi:hypothetical protein
MAHKLPIIGWLENRNGLANVSALETWNDGWTTKEQAMRVIVAAQDSLGRSLRGGLSAPVEEFMRVLKPRFKQCGYLIIKLPTFKLFERSKS